MSVSSKQNRKQDGICNNIF